MRLFKLSADVFDDEEDVQHYFDIRLPKQKWEFYFGDQISQEGIHPNETILFSFRGRLRYVAKAGTGRQNNRHRGKNYYPHFVVIKADIRKADIPLVKLGQEFRAKAGLKVSFKGQGWTIIPNSKRAEKVVEDLSFIESRTFSVNDVPDGLPAKLKQTVYRFIRDTNTSRQIKGLYRNRCQVCGKCLEIQPGVFYAEAHHLKPLGGEHKGPDVQDNILCLCPNHHALFDYFAISLDPAKLKFNKHELRQSFVDYHNDHFRRRHDRQIAG